MTNALLALIVILLKLRQRVQVFTVDEFEKSPE